MNPPESAASHQAQSAHSKRGVAWIGIALVALTIATFSSSIGHNFIDYDDPTVLTSEPMVTDGLSLKGLSWALTHLSVGHWDPLTTISHQATCEVFGLLPAGHHLVNVLLHSLAALLLFRALHSLTGTLWRSAMVAALFALHPLRVESVAWVTERKDVLSGVFCMLTLWSYSFYSAQRTFWRYLPLLASFALGLLSKSMLVTLPCVLLLLDYWPLEAFGARFDFRKIFFRIAEKLPLLALSYFSASIQMRAVQAGIEHLPLLTRISNALVCYVEYSRLLLFPSGLAIFYPYPETIPTSVVIVSAGIFLSTTIVSFLCRNRFPYLLVGWLWFVGMLVPVIGLVQVGTQSMADRYTYLTSIGFFIMLVWGASDLMKHWRVRPLVCWQLAGALVLACIWLSCLQLRFWENSETVFQRALDVTTRNYVAHFNLGNYYSQSRARMAEGVAEYQAALAINPDFADAHHQLGVALSKWPGRADESLKEISRALEIAPKLPGAHYSQGVVLKKLGRIQEAIVAFELAARRNPSDVRTFDNLGNALASSPGREVEAIEAYRKAIELSPKYAQAHNNLGALFLKMPGHLAEASVELLHAIRIKPDFVEAHCNLGLAYSQTKERIPDAIVEFETALRLQPEIPGIAPLLAALRQQMGVQSTQPASVPAN